MPERSGPKLPRNSARLPVNAGSPIAGADAAAHVAELEAFQARADQGVALLARADVERGAVLSRAIHELGLASAPPALLLANKLGAPGSTVQLGLDFRGVINVSRAQQIYRASGGAGSYIRLTGQDQHASFGLTLQPNYEGIYLAVVHAAGSAAQLAAQVWLTPGGGIHHTASRSSGKFLVPFEVKSYAYTASIVLKIPAGVAGDLEILRVDVTKVT